MHRHDGCRLGEGLQKEAEDALARYSVRLIPLGCSFEDKLTLEPRLCLGQKEDSEAKGKVSV